jgi:hypothetical protein
MGFKTINGRKVNMVDRHKRVENEHDHIRYKLHFKPEWDRANDRWVHSSQPDNRDTGEVMREKAYNHFHNEHIWDKKKSTYVDRTPERVKDTDNFNDF